MELYIGGRGQNKAKTAMLNLKLNNDAATLEGENLSMDDVFQAGIVNHFHLFVKNNLEELGMADMSEKFADRLVDENPGIVIIGDEIGYGIVPLSKEERDYREIYGRIMCLLSQRAKKVTRIICGICQVIKDEA